MTDSPRTAINRLLPKLPVEFWGGHLPQPKQLAALAMQPVEEVFFGGAAGGGKTDWLLMEASLYVHHPHYSGILFRESFPNLSHEPDGLIPRSREWFTGTGARYSGSTKTWYFPSGATLAFGYIYKEEDYRKYFGPSYQFIGYDESTEIRDKAYTTMFARLRRTDRTMDLPLRVRAASNPGGRSHAFFRDRFQLDKPPDQRTLDPARRAYIPSFISDNRFLDQDSYMETLQNLSPVERERLMRGDWTVTESGDYFKWEWFEFVQAFPSDARMVRSWDLAGTEPSPENPDPDYTVGLLLAEKNGMYWVCDVQRARRTPLGVEELVRGTAARDGKQVQIHIEQEPGSSGKATISHYRRNVLPGYTVRAKPSTGSKGQRALPVSSAAEAGNVKIVKGDWNESFLEEVTMFSDTRDSGHDDQVDALSGAFDTLTSHSEWWVA